MNQDLIAYYKERASEYEKVYHNPDEQNDLQSASEFFKELFRDKHVLEIACGTGYWTEQISKTAASIHATDINNEVLEIARNRGIIGNASFEIADMNNLHTGKKYDGLFGGFIWSHILLQDLDHFISKLPSLLLPGAMISLVDSLPVSGTNHDLKNICQIDDQGNTFQKRQLENGSSHLVLKNYPTKEFLEEKLSAIADDIEIIDLEYYWIMNGVAR